MENDPQKKPEPGKESGDRKEDAESQHTKLLGQILISEGLINSQQLELALEEQREDRKYLGVILMRHRWIGEKDLFKRLSDQRGVEFADVRELEIPAEVVDKVPREIALEYSVLPIYSQENELAVVMEDPFDDRAMKILRETVLEKIRPGLATRGDLHYAINRVYNNLVRSNPVVRDLYDGFAYLLNIQPFDSNRTLDLLIAASHLLNASDIHLIFTFDEMRIGLRIDGSLHNIPIPARRLKKEQITQLLNSLKIRSNIDPSKHGNPQDGRLEVSIDKGKIHCRVSILPLVDGEKVVLRIIGKLDIKKFDEIGLSVYHQEKILPVLEKHAGLVLVAGQTGSGKTTSLYALLGKIPTLSKSVVTIEDPVEARLRNASQVQVNHDKGFTFASALKSILRQDPDVILLGEIRDQESAVIAVESAMTGHMVLSSVHMEDAAGVILRLIHMGVEPFALASALSLIIAQRLAPRICTHCREIHPNSSKFAREFDLPEDITLYHGTGCEECYFSGRSGRIALFETIVVNDELRDLITRQPTLNSLMKFINEQGEQMFRDDALAKCHRGLIMPEDVLIYT